MAAQRTHGNLFRMGSKKLVLYIRRDDPDSADALELVRSFDPDVDVRYTDERSDVPETPWLVTPLSMFHGIDVIRGYIEHEAKKRGRSRR